MSVSGAGIDDDTREEVLGARGVSSVFIAVSKLVTWGLAVIGDSMPGRLEERAEKKGCSNSLPGDS